MTEDEKAAVSAFNAATANIYKALPCSKGGKKHEAAYGAAYHKLVQMGLAPPLRGRYRHG